MNGNDSEENKVNLTIREHYIAHLLLRKIYPNSIGLSLAIERKDVINNPCDSLIFLISNSFIKSPPNSSLYYKKNKLKNQYNLLLIKF